MEIAVVGARAYALRRLGGVPAGTFSSCASVPGRRWDLLALLPDARALLPRAARAGTLLLCGGAPPPRTVGASQVVGYGLSPRDTLTCSSLRSRGRIVCLQRSVLTLRGALIEPQEFLLPEAWDALPPEEALFLAGLSLLLGHGSFDFS